MTDTIFVVYVVLQLLLHEHTRQTVAYSARIKLTDFGKEINDFQSLQNRRIFRRLLQVTPGSRKLPKKKLCDC